MEDVLLNPSDQRLLVERISAGDRAAEEELVRWFHPRIFATLVCRTGDREASRDITQDVLMATLPSMRTGALPEPEKLAQFVHGVARNLANSHIRTISIRRPRETSLEPELEARLAAPISDVRQEHEAMEKSVRFAMSKLEPNDRHI